ncbi:ATP-dependent helicase [Mesorhizobium sp. M1C.F.Ca.ET.193.01.1.1]|uniref:ATP-dependent helicase n=1 Tax=unclassified Mesorhizobium TaxID=325217 RepID=UPI000FD409E8|nr:MULTISPECIES: ATP-dependent helicase [unclassified Mesorhizobium]TGS95767.1 ATP-dependent helicase [bacterium M00.F.Ca.ET.177.01.1.1]TGQ51835.1 ATP-dependent helicase [Mesorhizobium sp. M1C.F.Ca.ET.210.01.1.1]TGQ68079.1 ATP-dependent helicase [Mesorhizobium sp. M1C.F.Ca.ET.212.01.1.1]TGR03358.1 ATP-dependent helicase [Mesorhizobium sp. M1C.F.Ca.ET.204.01.1.1]TGR23975.1 ATP-dependent helicase [Mesorhizobium sp. M1C.F.Ca.ET.196.01.1.1]
MNIAARDSSFEAPAYLARLNDEQRLAVVHGDGKVAAPLLVIAGAGSGKTNTLAHRVAHLIVKGADPRRILLMTFSRRAASEMAKRVERIAGEVLGRDAAIIADALAWAGTFHGIGARLLRDYAEQIGLDAAFTIHDREDSADLMNLARHELGFSKTESRFPTKGTCLQIYSRAVNAQAPLGEVLGSAFPWCAAWAEQLKELFAAYVEAKQAQNVLDYDDLLLYWAQMAAEPEIAAHLGSRFDHVLVDEYQDTNRLQASILLALKPDGVGLTVVGDDAQSIYSFRAAEVRNILDFPKQFAQGAEIVMLERNYRSTETILAAANAVIGEATERFTKNLWTERRSSHKPQLVSVRDETEQANYVCQAILAEREAGTALKAQAVLFRASHHSGPLEVELTRRNIPFVKFGGLKFLDAAHVKDMLAMLRFAENPRDRVAGFRVLQLMPGIGPSAASQIVEAMATSLDETLGLARFRPPQRAAQDWPVFLDIYSGLRAGPKWPADLERVRLWYEPHMERIHEDAITRRADLLQLEQIASGYPSRERFLTELTLDPPDATSDQAGPPHRDEDYLILSTIHSAKGQEWKNVFVLNTVDGCIPADLGVGTKEDIEEERRLLYVAMTRAKDSLHLVVPQRFYPHNQPARGDRHVYASRTRFIPASMLSAFEQSSWASAAIKDDPRQRPGVKVDLGARMRGMWK